MRRAAIGDSRHNIARPHLEARPITARPHLEARPITARPTAATLSIQTIRDSRL